MEKLITRIQRYIENHPSDPSAYNDLFDLFASQSEGAQQRTEWNERNRALRGQMIQQMGHHVGGATLSEFVRLQKKSLLIDTPVDFDAYMQFVEFERDPEKRFYLPRRKVMRSTVADELPCLVTKLDVDGEFGANTARAVYTFQSVYGIKVDSKYGPESHKALMTALEELGKPVEAPDEPTQSSGTKVVTIVSQKLVNLRNGDSLEAGCVTQVKGGTKLEYVTTINSWHGVRWKNRIVWVSGQFSTVAEA